MATKTTAIIATTAIASAVASPSVLGSICLLIFTILCVFLKAGILPTDVRSVSLSTLLVIPQKHSYIDK
jgi:hypothetical protein